MNRMSLYSPSIERLIESFEKLPSIGHKTAARLAFYILNSTEEETNKFVTSSVYSKSPPTGTPCAILVTLIPKGFRR